MTTLRTLTYSYDAASQLVSASDPEADYTFTYDNLGRNTSTEYDYAALGFDVVVDESYDALGRRTQLSAEIDGTDDLLNEYEYDYLNRLTQVTQDAQSGGNAVAEKRVDFNYDAEDKQQFASISRYADLAGSDTVAISTYGYDDTDRLTSLTHVDGSSGSLAGYTWQYDEGNRLTDFTVSGYSAEDATYSYDDTDQLTAADRSGTSADESYAYDDNGNRTGGSYSTGDDNQLSSDGTFNYTYDDEGNRLTKTNISTGEVFEYSWDYRNRLTSITTKDNVGTITHEVEYTYDIFNRRIAKTIDADGAGAGTATEEIYIHEGLREERDGAGDQILLMFDESGDLTDRYLHGPTVDQVLASEEVTSPSTAGDVLWALSDNLGSVRDVAEYDASTDTTTVVNHLTYDAFGNVTNETNASVDFLFAYTGRERDTESDLQYNRARYYDAAIGRWISTDPIGFAAGDINLYRYVGNGPMGATDPGGQFTFVISPVGSIMAVSESGDTLGDAISLGFTDTPFGHEGIANIPLTAGTQFDISALFPPLLIQAIQSQQHIRLSDLAPYIKRKFPLDPRIDLSQTVGESGIELAFPRITTVDGERTGGNVNSILLGNGQCHGFASLILGVGLDGVSPQDIFLSEPGQPQEHGVIVTPTGIEPYLIGNALPVEVVKLGDIVVFKKNGELMHTAIVVGISRGGEIYVVQKMNSCAPILLSPLSDPRITPSGTPRIYPGPERR